MKRLLQLGSLLFVLASLPAVADDASTGKVKKVEVFPSATEVRIEITLSTPTTPLVETAQHPDRLVVKLPGTISEAQQKRISVQKHGVRTVRYGLNHSDPPETHLVVDLDDEHPYRVTTDGTKITLFIEPSLRAEARKRTPPAAAASKPLIHSLGRGSQSDSGTPDELNSDGTLLTPPPSGPPIQFPSVNTVDNSTGASTTASAAQPSARHPNFGSLQEGTVFPSAGAPGTGVVPPVSGTPQAGPLDNASANQPPAAPSTEQTSQPIAPSIPSTQSHATATQTLAEAPSVQSTPAAPQPGSTQASLNPRVNPGSTSSVTANAAQGSVQPQRVPQEAKPATAPPSETAPPVQQASEPSPPTSEQADASTAAKTPVAASAPVQSDQPIEAGPGEEQIQSAVSQNGSNPDFRTAFRVKYVVPGTAYLDGGRAGGLTEGMKLVVRDLPNAGGVATQGANSSAAGDVATLEVLSVAENSAVTEIHDPRRPVRVGDLAYLSAADQQALVEKNALSATRKYPAVVSFTENDTLDDEARAEVPKPPSPAVNRSRGRIGFNYIGVLDHGVSNMYTNEIGLVLRTDITRIGGSYWNASGYWNGRFTHTSNTGPQTLQDLINRTYTLYTSYDNPNSPWVAGFGRLYLPWATSLDTLDGGYVGRKVTPGVTSGMFFGSTPDPTSWSYAPDRRMGGAFVNFQGGTFDDFHYTSTIGAGMQMVKWTPDRPFVFFESNLNYKRVFSIYQASQIDSHAAHTYPCPTSTIAIPQCTGQTLNGGVYTGGTYTQAGTKWGLGRSFTTVRFAPVPRLEFNVNHTYYRDLPFLDPSSITSAGVAAGLFDKFLTQGTMGGVRVEVLKRIWLSANLGLSSHSGDSKSSLNQMFGITFGRIPWVKANLDARYSRFNSAFGTGSYESLSFTRNLSEGLQLQVLAGQQNFYSTLTSANTARFVNGMIESNLGRHYFIQAGGTISRGNQMNYDQWLFTFGYRFDNRHGQKVK
jgi:hypothetical protein